ncbi:unknown [Prevotella sp. CAG:1124]|nr:unknown [Prevotella sp. CAG:1124]
MRFKETFYTSKKAISVFSIGNSLYFCRQNPTDIRQVGLSQTYKNMPFIRRQRLISLSAFNSLNAA